ncbi:hypothetical protein FHR24_000531 [Wenyingzhuangia heitensis]|uniref:Lipid A 3-O-deacylase (PagL) n=1 Tax=Wenyingzhuangia heitensis TaxID=1487859 RepID=A0ABX0U5G2_9FLAO|nr:acyloxyacyl hydrolase [Wenyingzhuangia heitensis]NIJ44092.1 hypothetical protein [Wenyingzhuangia heitensis]
MSKSSVFLHYFLCTFGFIIYLSCISTSFGQKTSIGNIKVFFNAQVGSNMDEEPVRSITNQTIQAFEIGLIKETIGNNEWEQLYNYPEYGISLFYSSLGNNQVFGHEIAVVPFIKIKLFSKNNFSVFGRIGMGFSYLNTITDPVLNPENPATSNHYNFHTNLRTGITYLISKRMELNSGISFDHISNGNTKKPNLGLNNITAYAGLSYVLQPRIAKKQTPTPPHSKHNDLLVYLGIGGKRSNFNSSYYIVHSLSTELRRSLTKMFSLGIGTNIYWDPSVKPSLLYLNKESSLLDNLQTGVYISQSFNYNKLSISLQEGAYVFLYDKVDKNYFYTSANLAYNFYKKLFIRLSLKSHKFHILDHPEIGLGYKF